MNRPQRKPGEEKHHEGPPAEKFAPAPGTNCTKCQDGGGPKHSTIEDNIDVFNEFYPYTAALIRRMAAVMHLPAEQRDDVLQEVWLAVFAYLKRHHKNTVRNWRGWLRGLMRHKIADAKHCQCHAPVSLDALNVEQAVPAGDGIDQMRRTWLSDLMAELAADESLNICLLCGRFREGGTNGEVATAHNLTAKAVERRICRVVAELRQKAVVEGLVPMQEEGGGRGRKWKK